MNALRLGGLALKDSDWNKLTQRRRGGKDGETRNLTQRREGGKDARIEVYVDWMLCGSAAWRLGVEMIGKWRRSTEFNAEAQRREEGRNDHIGLNALRLGGLAALR